MVRAFHWQYGDILLAIYFFVFTYYFVGLLSLKNKYTTNNVQRSLTSLLLRVILAHTLANIGDDAGAFILFSLVTATQRRRQLPPAAGAGGSICR